MLTELSALLDLLKTKGVTRFDGPIPGFPSGGRIDVTFAPPAAELPEEEKSKPQDMCKCGHELAHHQGGLCMHACDEEKCA